MEVGTVVSSVVLVVVLVGFGYFLYKRVTAPKSKGTGGAGRPVGGGGKETQVEK